MKRLILLCIPAVVLSVSVAESDIEVIEVFRAETVEELEASLTDGYPMPWLEEILNDETIPEEDRYWLDCRVRAVIAQDLHLFFDREGNPVHIEVDWIAPGEDYWRENFTINPSGYNPSEGITPSEVPGIEMEPGQIVNMFGEELGEIPFSNYSVLLSRDGQIGVTPTGAVGRRHAGQQCYACFQYPDGGFSEVPIDVIDGYSYAISADGSRSIFACRVAQTSNADNTLWVFDEHGDLIFKKSLPRSPLSGVSRPAVSPDGSVIAVALTPDFSDREDQGGVLLLDGDSGEELLFIDYLMGHTLRFTSDGKNLCIGGLSGAAIIDTETLEIVWSKGIQHAHDETEKLFCPSPSIVQNFVIVRTRNKLNNPLFTALPPHEFGFAIFEFDGNRIYEESLRTYPDISPSGEFVFCQAYSIVGSNSWNDYLSVPMVVFRVEGGE